MADDGGRAGPEELEPGSARWLAGVVEQSTDAVIVIDRDGLIAYANPAVAMVGWQPADLIGRSGFDFLHPDDVTRAVSTLAAVERDQRPLPGLIRLRGPDGQYTQLDVTPGLYRDEAGRAYSVYTMRPSLLNQSHWHTLSAILAGRPVQEALHLLATGLSSAVDGPMGITFDDGGRLVTVGELPAALSGWYPSADGSAPAGHPYARAVSADEVVVAVAADLGPEIAAQAVERGLEHCVVVPVPDPGADRPALMVQWPPDRTMADLLSTSLPRRPRQILALALQRRADQARLEHLALHDPLTGLPNRAQFFAVLDRAMRGREPGLLCYVDLDGFKEVNDERGHLAGDAVLVRCAGRLAGAARAGDLVARLGGDEFALFAPGVGDEATAGELAQRLVDAVTGDPETTVGASVGAAIVAPGTSTDEAVLAADGALYEAKRAGRGTWRLAPSRVHGTV